MRNVRIRFTTSTKAKQVNDTKDAAQTNQPTKKEQQKQTTMTSAEASAKRE